MAIKKLSMIPRSFGAAAVFPYSDNLMEFGSRMSRFGDPYHLFKVIGSGDSRRILVPRGMVTDPGGHINVSMGVPVTFTSKFKPRDDEQARVVAETIALLEEGDNFIVESPTGSGKTVMSMGVIAAIGRKTLVVVTKEDLRDQWVRAAQEFLGLTSKDIGFIQGDKFQVSGKKFVISMVQSLAIDDRYPTHELADFGLVIFDETHRLGADFFSQACFKVPALLRLGLSATPYRKDGREDVFMAHIGPVKVQSFIAPLTPKIIVRQSPWSLPMVPKTENGKARVVPLPHSPGKCGHVVNMLCKHHGRNTMIAEFISSAYKKGRVTMVMSDRKEHLETLAMLSQKMGVPTSELGYYVGGMKEAELDVSKAKKVILCTYQMTSEGTNIPWADTLVLGSPKSDVVQIVGRILRLYEGKKDPVVLDIVDATSSVFSGYWNSRKKWYGSIKAEVVFGNGTLTK